MSGVTGLDTRYIICDQKGQLISALDCAGSTPFFDDTITNAIATNGDTSSDGTITFPDNFSAGRDLNANSKEWESTLEISVPIDSPISRYCALGNILLDYDENVNEWYAYKIYSEENDHTDPSGHQVNKLECLNLLNWRLGKYIPTVHSMKNVEAKQAFQILFASSGWQMDWQAKSTMNGTIDFDGENNAQSYLQTMLQAFDVEVDAHIEVSSTRITKKICTIVDKLGSSTPVQNFYYGKNIKGISRTTLDTNLVTKLWVRDSNGKDISNVNAGMGFLLDNRANDLYNGGSDDYLEGVVVSQTIMNHKALLDWGRQILKVYNHPRANYEITVPSNYNIKLGDTVSVVDYAMTPTITITARAIQVEKCKANQTIKITFGEFVPVKVVTPSAILRLQNQMNDRVQQLIDDVKNGTKIASVHLVTPTGANWTTAEDSKTVIAKVFVDSVNLTTYLSNAAFIWQKTNPVTGIHDTDWEKRHTNDGALITLNDGDIGTITCKINGAYLKNQAEIINQENYKQVWSYNFKNSNKDPWGEGIYKAPQYVHIDQGNGFLIFSSAYDNDAANTKQRGPTSDTKYHRFKLDGTYMDSMVLQGGGHGSSFGYRFVDGMPEIWTTIQTKSDGDFLGRVKYQPNTVVKLGDKSVVNMCPLKNFKRISVDFEHGWVLAVAASNGSVEITSMDNVTSGNWTPSYKFNTSDYDFKQWTGAYQEGMHELQSNDIYFPYVFLNAGHFNNKDKRLSICVNVITESQVFRHVDTTTMLPDGLIIDPANDSSSPFEPETIGYYHNGGKPYLLQGFDYHRIKDSSSNTFDSLATLWKTDLVIRDDSGDVTTYDETANDDNTGDADNAEGSET